MRNDLTRIEMNRRGANEGMMRSDHHCLNASSTTCEWKIARIIQHLTHLMLPVAHAFSSCGSHIAVLTKLYVQI